MQVLNSRPKGKTLAGPPDVGFGGRKAPSSMGKIGTAEVLRLRAPSAVSRDKAVRRFAQDDGLVGVSKNIPVGCAKNKKNQKSHDL